QTWFRCAGRTSPSGKRCAPEPDPVLRDRTGFGGALPPAFAADGRKGAATCPECMVETTIIICPVCHSRLPVHFGKVGSRLIVPVGAKEAGKTVFMTVLVHELMHQTDHRRGRFHPLPVRQRLRAAAVSRVPAASAHRGGRNIRPGTARLPLHHRGVPPAEGPAAPCRRL